MSEGKKRQDQSTKEALLNELKGNLFEYLVGLKLSESFSLKSKFTKNINPDYMVKLKDYEGVLRGLDQALYLQLPYYAKQTGFKIYDSFCNQKIKQIELTGKLPGSDEINHEGDLKLVNENNEIIYISLKLYKKNAYVNTKSAGLNSFIKRYFSCFETAEILQESLNQKFKFIHQSMLQSLNELAGLPMTTGGLHPNWKKLGLSELPGKLPKEFSLVLYDCYHQICSLIHEVISNMYKQNPTQFFDCLKPLMGFSSQDVVQVFSFYESTLEKRYSNLDVALRTVPDENDQSIEILSLKNGKSSFNICINDDLLQIRVKPMSSFIAPSFKINCALKLN